MKKLLYGLLFIPSLLFADVKVSNLNEQLYPKTTDYMYIVANSTSMKVSLSSLDGLIKSVLISTVVYTNTAQTISGSKTFSSSQTINNDLKNFSSNVSPTDKLVTNPGGVFEVWKDQNDEPAKPIADFKYIYDDGLQAEYTAFQIDSGSITASVPLFVLNGIQGSGLVANNLIDGSSITKQGLLVAGSGVTLTPAAGTLTITATGGGGGSSALGVFLNGVSVSSPTDQINFRSPLVATLGGTSTATITVDGSSVTLQGNTFNAANKLLQLSASNLITNSLIDASSVTKQGNTFNGANQLLQLTSGGLITNSLVDGSSITKQGVLTAGSNIILTPSAGSLSVAVSSTVSLTSATVSGEINIPNGTDPIINSVGDMGVDTTSGQLLFHNNTEVSVLSSTRIASMGLESPVDTDFPIGWRTPYDITITSLVCVSSAATSATINFLDCNGSNGASCNTLWASASCGTTEFNVGLSSSVVAGRRIRPQVISVSGTPGWLGVDVYYKETRK